MYVCPMTTAQNSVYDIRVILDPILALNEFVITPVADRFGITGEEVEARYDVELIFSTTTEYDSINGREGFRRRRDVDTDRFWELVALYEN